jgi:hypothetical protein
MLRTLKSLGARIDRIVVVDLREGTYYAEIHLDHGDQTYLVDSRPSDAIALAVRENALICANETLLEQVGKQFQQQHEVVLKDEESEKWTDFLEKFDVDDTKYKM